MLLQRTNLAQSIAQGEAAPSSNPSPSEPDDALTCMIYFFASQMSRNLRRVPTGSDRNSGNVTGDITQIHRLDTLLQKLEIHASFSPLITRFETFPVEIPKSPAQSNWRTTPPNKAIHDTMLLVKFRSKNAREEWIATREWGEFMHQTEKEDVFRRIPHVRCARTLKGLRDPIEILST